MLAGFLSYLLGENWAMEPVRLESLLHRFSGAGIEIPGNISVTPHAAGFFDDAPARSRMSVADGVATIPITGVLMKSVPKIFSYFGIDATSYAQIVQDVAQANADPQVTSIMLAVDSPGGQVSGVAETGEAIKASAKPVASNISGIGASAAYWLAAQAKPVSASMNSLVGSIGVYVVQVDSSEAAAKDGFKVHVISSGPFKGAGAPGSKITAEHLAATQEIVDGLSANFVAAVASGRGVSAGTAKGWASGKLWLADEAARLGLVDTAGVASRLTGKDRSMRATMILDSKENEMDEKQVEAERVAAIAQERKRASDIKAAFPRHAGFALAQIEAGATLIEAKVAFTAVLEQEVTASKAGQESAEKQLAASKGVAGAAPVPAGGAPSGAANADFMALAKEAQYEHQKICIDRINHKDVGQPDCCTLTAAMSKLSGEQPKLHAEYVEAGAVRAGARKRALGWM
jgi:signal peptide peptidase SppA